MDRINASVGVGCHNGWDDVRLVQSLLGRHARWLGTAMPPLPTGTYDAGTDRAIRAFQENGAALLQADGIVSPNGYTFKALSLASIPGPKHRLFTPVCWTHGDALTEQDFTAAAKTLGCEVAMIRAVAEVETKRSPWDDLGRPTILFEHAKFSQGTGKAWRATNHVYDHSHPDISGHGPYGTFSKQYSRLTRAAMLDEPSALQSASYGTFQIMGFNYAACGYADVAAFVDAMLTGEREHLAAFVAIIQSMRLQKALSNQQWADFARTYNGPDYRKNDYDTKMAAAYAKWKGKP